jgi:4'-phosphopantetheinyl transferase
MPLMAALDGSSAFGDGEVDVWFTSLTPDRLVESEAWNLLSAEERDRAGRLQQAGDRAVQVRTRGVLRQVLASYLGIGAGEVAIGEGPDGKPEVVDPDRPRWPHFNVSHSGSVAVIAVSGFHKVGVDVELLRDIPWREVAHAFFAPDEVAAIASTAPDLRRKAFFDCWVRKEAYLKGLGTGLRRPTSDFRVSLGSVGGIVHDPTLRRPTGGPTWYVHPIELGLDYAAALAVDHRDVRAKICGAWSAGV